MLDLTHVGCLDEWGNCLGSGDCGEETAGYINNNG